MTHRPGNGDDPIGRSDPAADGCMRAVVAGVAPFGCELNPAKPGIRPRWASLPGIAREVGQGSEAFHLVRRVVQFAKPVTPLRCDDFGTRWRSFRALL